MVVHYALDQNLNSAACRPASEKARGNHLRIIADNQVARAKQFRQIRKMKLAGAAIPTSDNEQAALSPSLKRMLCDLSFGQVKIKIFSPKRTQCLPAQLDADTTLLSGCSAHSVQDPSYMRNP